MVILSTLLTQLALLPPLFLMIQIKAVLRVRIAWIQGRLLAVKKSPPTSLLASWCVFAKGVLALVIAEKMGCQAIRMFMSFCHLLRF
jgi:hypothetical protein